MITHFLFWLFLLAEQKIILPASYLRYSSLRAVLYDFFFGFGLSGSPGTQKKYQKSTQHHIAPICKRCLVRKVYLNVAVRNQVAALGRRQGRRHSLALVVVRGGGAVVVVVAVDRRVAEDVRRVRHPKASPSSNGGASTIRADTGYAHVVGRGVVGSHGPEHDTVGSGAVVALVEAAVEQDGELKDGFLGMGLAGVLCT